MKAVYKCPICSGEGKEIRRIGVKIFRCNSCRLEYVVPDDILNMKKRKLIFLRKNMLIVYTVMKHSG